MSEQLSESGGRRRKFLSGGGRNLILVGVALGALFWLADPVVDSVLLGAGSLREQYFSPEPEEIFARWFVFALMAGFGVYAQSLVDRRRRAEEALRERDESLGDLFENANDLIQVVSPEGRLLYVNRAWRQTLGYSEEEVPRLSLSDIVHPDSRGDCMASFQRLVSGESLDGVKAIFLARDGRPITVEGNCNCRFDDGRPVYVRGIFRDVTARKAAEEALRASEEWLRVVVENIDEVVYVVAAGDDPVAGTVQFVSGGVKNILGYEPDEFLRDPTLWFQMVHPDDVPRLVETTGSTYENGEPVTREYRLRRKDTTDFRWMEDHVVPQVDEGGKVVGIQGVARDITERRRAEEALRASEERLRSVFDTARDPIYTTSPDGTITSLNPAFETVTGWPREEWLGKNFGPLIHPDDLPLAMGMLERLLRGETPPVFELRVLSKTGEYVVGEFAAAPLTEGGQIVGVLGIARDITERKRAEAELVKLSQAVEQTGDNILITDKDGVIEYVNPMFERVTGFSREYAIGQTPRILKSGKQSPRFYKKLWETISSGEVFRAEFINKKKDGELFHIEKVISPIKDARGNITHFVSTGRDITQRKQAEQAIRRLIYHDTLTGVPNRALFQDRLTVALAQARRDKQQLAVMCLDIDRFKVVNDTLGHVEGDQLLRSVAGELTGLLREGNTVARVGGDEFALLLPAIPALKDAVTVAAGVLEGLRRPRLIAGHELQITTSIGVAIYPDDGQDAEALLSNAAAAMHQAKEQGRDNYQLYTPAMNAVAMERLTVESGLRRAVERQEFVAYYQPMADISSGRMVGAEALIRWQHPERGLVLPGEFIALAEETGLIVPLGEWVLRAACAQNRAWQQAGLPPLRVSVNLSARQFHLGLVDCVSSVLADTGLAPRFLGLEITEGTAMRNPEITVEVLRQLREMGVHISVDDFGTGYSSLSYLKRFPIHSLKIDRAFVRDLASDENDAAITTAIIAMAHSMKLDVTAEGVETEEQLAFLRQRQCDEFQGFLLARPMPAEALAKMLARGAPLPASPGARDGH